MARGLGPTRHASRLRAEEANRRARCVQPPSGYKRLFAFAQTNGRKGRAAMQAACNRAKWAHFSDSNTPSMEARPTRHATGAPNASCMQQHRHLRHYRASSTAEPIPRLEATQRTTQQRQPGAAVNAAKNGPTLMTVAGGQEQRPRRQPSSRPVRGQRENPLSRREDNAPVIRSSNGSRTHNDRPANHSPRRINSAVGQAAPLSREAGDASPSP
jgi:hypothetical protein